MSKPKIKLAVFACVFLLVVVTNPSTGAQQANEAERIFAHAVELHQAGDIEGAIREYKLFLTLRPKVPEARSNLGAALARAGRYEEAIEQYKQALALDNRNTQVRFNLAVAYYKAALLIQASEEFAKVIVDDPANKNALLLQADCQLRLGEYKNAITLLSPLASSEPDNLTVAYILGSAYIQDGQYEKGQVLIDRILRNGESAEALLMMGTAQLMMRDYPGAIKEFERAIELNPKLPKVRSFYGQALFGTGERTLAMKAFEAELENNANDFEANFYIGMLLKDDQKFDEALKYFQRALNVRPHELNVIYFIANTNMALGKTVDAQRLLEGVVKEAPDFVEAHVLLATVYYRLKQKGDGDRERAIVQKLNAERQAEAPGAKEGLGPAYRGEPVPKAQPNRKPENKPQ